MKENIKAARHWPLCGEFTGDRCIPRTKGHQRGKCFHLMTSHGVYSWVLSNEYLKIPINKLRLKIAIFKSNPNILGGNKFMRYRVVLHRVIKVVSWQFPGFSVSVVIKAMFYAISCYIEPCYQGGIMTVTWFQCHCSYQGNVLCDIVLYCIVIKVVSWQFPGFSVTVVIKAMFYPISCYIEPCYQGGIMTVPWF